MTVPPRLRSGRFRHAIRYGELGGDETMSNYAVGKNIPGYLPESDVWITDDFDAAKRALCDELDRYGDYLDEIGLTDAAEEITADMEDVNLLGPTPVEWSGVYPTSDSAHDLGLAFWLAFTDEMPETDE